MSNPTTDLLKTEITEVKQDFDELSKYCTELEQNLNSQKTILLLKQKTIESHEETIRLIKQAEAQE